MVSTFPEVAGFQISNPNLTGRFSSYRKLHPSPIRNGIPFIIFNFAHLLNPHFSRCRSRKSTLIYLLERNNINLLVAFPFSFFTITILLLLRQNVQKKVYKGCLTPESPPILLKHRFRKNYRHLTLDASLTKMRVAGEARALLKCLR